MFWTYDHKAILIIHRPSTPSQIVPLRHWKTRGILSASRSKGIFLFSTRKSALHSAGSFRERKLFIRRVRKRKITRPVCLVKQNKLIFVYDLFYWTQTKHFVDFLKYMMPWLFRSAGKKCRRITLIKSVSQPRRLASRRRS